MRKVALTFMCAAFITMAISCQQHAPQPVREDIKTSTAGVVKYGNMYFFSGLVGRGADGTYPQGMTAQTKNLMEVYKTALTELGMTFDNIIKANVYITKAEDKPAMNAVYGSYFTGKKPMRVCVVVGLEGEAIVEMDAIAVK